jgi:hypothetical protein
VGELTVYIIVATYAGEERCALMPLLRMSLSMFASVRGLCKRYCRRATMTASWEKRPGGPEGADYKIF